AGVQPGPGRGYRRAGPARPPAGRLDAGYARRARGRRPDDRPEAAAPRPGAAAAGVAFRDAADGPPVRAVPRAVELVRAGQQRRNRRPAPAGLAVLRPD